MAKMNRRGFMVGCSAAIAAMAGSRLSHVAFGNPEQEPNQDILLVVFLRGGMDGINAVPVISGPDREHYENNREYIAVPTSGANAALPLDARLGLHPGAVRLHELYQANKLAVVQAAGMFSDTRSHFDAMEYMELGTPDVKTSTTGWLTRHLNSGGEIPREVIMPAMSVGNLSPTSLVGSREAIGMTDPRNFNLNTDGRYSSAQRQGLRTMYSGTSWLHNAGIQTLDAIDVVEFGNPGNYTPANGADYGADSFSRNLRSIAQIIKMQLGLRLATIDLGGWDTHDSQGESGDGYFADHLGRLAQGLHAFYTDLNGNPNEARRVTIVVMSEFGRSLKENGSRGTDHGHGNVMFLLGDQVKGGKVHGQWPGLHRDQLYDNRDLEITTDYRRVLSEILIRRMGNPNLGYVFPNYMNYTPLDIVQGADLPVNYEGQPVDPPTPTPDPGGTIPEKTPVFPTDVPEPPVMMTPTPPGNAQPTATPVVDPNTLTEKLYMPSVSKN